VPLEVTVVLSLLVVGLFIVVVVVIISNRRLMQRYQLLEEMKNAIEMKILESMRKHDSHVVDEADRKDK